MQGLGLPIQMLNGLRGIGCPDCGGGCNNQSMYGFGAVADYDQITIGGKLYTVNQIVGKNVIASKDTKIYSGVKGTPRVLGVVKTGQPIGIVYSYLRPEQTDGRSWLQFDGPNGATFFVPNEAVGSTGLKEQGTLTVTQEVKVENDAKLKEDSPVEYYLKKYGTTVLLVIVGTIVVVSLGKEAVKGALTKKAVAPTPALSGTKKGKKRK